MALQNASFPRLLVLAGLAVGCASPDHRSGGPAGPEVASAEARQLVSRLSALGGGRYLGASAATGFTPVEEGLRPVVRGLGGRAGVPVEVTLPARADGAMRLREKRSGVEIAVRLVGAEATGAERHEGYIVYPGRDGHGTLLRPLDDGAEDHHWFPVAPAREEVRYAITLAGAGAGLRLIGGVLEVLDGQGVPRLRVPRPVLVGAEGQRVGATMSVEGCAVDTSPAMPWRRPVVATGASPCELVVRWAGVRYPAALDPAWKSTLDMAVPRQRHGAVLLDTGDVLVAGGIQPGTVTPGTDEQITQIFMSPLPTTYGELGSWAMTGSLNATYEEAPMARVRGGRFLIATGNGPGQKPLPLSSAALYDPATGVWTDMPAMPEPRPEPVAVGLDDGRAMIIGGEGQSSCWLFDPDTQTWTQTGSMSKGRRHFTATVLAKDPATMKDGKVLVTGGLYVVKPGENDPDNTTEVYDPESGAWTAGPTMKIERRDHSATRLSDGRVLIAGGIHLIGGSSFTHAAVEVYDPATGTLASLVDLTSPRAYHRAALLGDGRVLLTAGDSETEFNPTAELYDVGDAGKGTPNQTTLITAGVTPRDEHVTISLGGMKALSCGGKVLSSPSSTAELFDLYPQGTPCLPTLADNGDSECLSLHCVDGFCCDTACDGECRACSGKRRGDSVKDGVCGPIAAGQQARGASDQPPLPADDAASCRDRKAIDPCSTQGTCNGADPGEGAKDSKVACVYGEATLGCGDGTVCAPPTFSFQRCDGLGKCIQISSCGLYAGCATPTTCADHCAKDSECVAGAFCGADKTCQALGKPGDPCEKDTGCGTGHCVSKVCCNEACDGPCRACTQEGKGSGADGTCGNAKAGTDPGESCLQTDPDRCGTTGSCDGNGGCEVYGDETACGELTACGPDFAGTFEVYDLRCHASQCVAATQGKSCGFYRCDAAKKACASACTSDIDCTAAARCDLGTGTCIARRSPGASCTLDQECGTGICSDGVCCTTRCEGQCEACNVKTLEGICVAVEGKPPTGRPACAAATDGAPCSARRCDGVNPQDCTGYVADEESCAAAACSEDKTSLLGAATCAGNGTCHEPPSTPCAPYLCAATDGAARCGVSCQADADCARNSRCDGGKCVASAGCDDASHLRLVDGTVRACAPYRCDDAHRTCLETCASSAECASGSVCSGAGRCEAPSRPDTDTSDTGCGCKIGGPAAPGAPGAPRGLLLAAVAVGVAIRRRTRARSARIAGPLGALFAPLAALLAAGCHQASPAPEAAEQGPDRAAPPAPDLAVARAARERIDALFRREIRPARGLEALAGGAGVQPPIPPAMAREIQQKGEEITASFGERWQPPVALTLPAHADGAVSLEDRRSGLGLRARPIGADRAARAQIEGGYVSYADAYGPGTRIIHRPSPGGTEDHVLVEARGLRELAYRVTLGERVAGLRLVAGTLEALDAGGAPRLRVGRPYVLAAGGQRVEAALALEGCAADRSAAPPWGRPVTAPGARECVLRVRWPELEPPFLVDPNWNFTGDMAESRAFHTTTSLPDGRVLVSGGAIDIGLSVLRKTAEIYDPASGTWASVDSMHTGRVFQGAWVLKSGRVLVGVGRTDEVGSAMPDATLVESLDLTTGQWTVENPLGVPPRDTQANGVTADGQPFFCGGTDHAPVTTLYYDDAYLYDESAGAWQKTPGSMKIPRFYHRAFTLPDGRLLIAAGKKASGATETLTTTAEYFDPKTGTFSDAPPMKASRYFVGAAATPTGIVFAGGVTDGLPPLQKTVEFYSFATGAFEAFGALNTVRAAATATWVPGIARVLVAGGISLSQVEAVVESVDPVSKSIQTVGSMNEARGLHGASLLTTGQVLVSGGGTGNLTKISEVFQSAELFGQVADGSACKGNDSCSSGHCVDGVCCGGVCDGFCEACSAARKGAGADGVCEPISAGQDPDGECPTQDVSTCGLTGACNGKGACAHHPDGLICQDLCEAGQEKHGTCQSGACLTTKTPCGSYACDPNAKQCFASCTTASQCASDAYCDGVTGKCVGTLAQGSPCDPTFGSATCATGFCVEGVCCDEACTGGCHSCLAKNHQASDATQDGFCLPSRAAQPDPQGKCLDSGAACADRGLCDGKGNCETYQDGDACGDPFCNGGSQIGFAVEQYTCKGKVCSGGVLAQRHDCGVFGCSQGACATMCASDTDCSSRGYCQAGTCLSRHDLGASCVDDRACLSGFCVDGYCCTTACEGQCSACDIQGQEGTCLPTHEAPRSPRAPCAAATDGAPCSARRCDGITTTSCEGHVGSETICHEDSCQDGHQSSVALCDGKGKCGEIVSRDCFPYACGAAACLEACARDAECASGAHCQAGHCVTLPSCDEARGVLRSASGAVLKECGLYRCLASEGTCRTTCQSSADCLTGNVCTANGACAPASAPGETAASCACSAPGASPAGPSGLLALLGLLLAPRLRRSCRSCRSCRPSTTKS